MHHSHAAEIELAEGGAGTSGDDRSDVLADERAINGVAVAAKITGDADLGMIRYREIGVDNDPPTAIDLATRGLCQLLSQMGRFHASGPDHRCCLDSNGSASDQLEPFQKEAVEKADATKI